MPGHSSLLCADCINLSAMPGIHVITTLALAPWRRLWQSAGSNRYGMMEPAGISAGIERGPSDTSAKQANQENSAAGAIGAAPAAFIHRPRHYRRRRLCLAEGCQLAGGAARSRRAERGYPDISRSGERLHRGPARPYRRLAKDAGRRAALADQG